MKKKLPIILLGVILACVLVFGFLYANNDIGKTANSLEADIRQSQKILDDWIVDGSISDTMAAFISYPQDKTDHTFSVYPRRRIPYPLPAYGRKCADTEPVKLANAAPAVEASFAGAGVQRAASPLCRGAGAAAHCWGQGATPIGGLRAAAIIGSRTKCLGGLRAAAPSGQG